MKRRILSPSRMFSTGFTAIALLAGSFIPASAGGVTYYVAKNGNDGNSCSAAQGSTKAKLTIKNGIGCLKAGDTLDIRGGTYSESLDAEEMTFPSGTSWTDAPQISGHSGESVVLRPMTNPDFVIRLSRSSIQYLIFRDLVIDATGAATGIRVMNGAHHIRFQGLEVKNSTGQGVLGSVGSSGPADGRAYAEYLNMKVHDNGANPQFDHGFYIETANNLIEGCDIYNNAAFGVQLYRQGSTTLPNNNIVRRNYIHNNSRISVRGGIVVSGPNNTIVNNIITNNKEDGVSVGFGAANNNKIFNNTIFGHLYFGIQIRSGMTGNQIGNNIVYANSSAILDSGSGTVLLSNLTSNPNFVNASGGDFQVKAGSPAINAGSKIGEVSDDYAGTLRPVGGAWDIGAYEWTLGVPGVPPPAAPVSLRVETATAE